MNLTFTRLIVNNFKSVVEADLKLNRQPGLHFIRGENWVEPRLGSNGAGKSTLFDALCWCLFGKTPGGLRNPDIVPWGDKKPTASVVLGLEVNTEYYEICRTYNPGTLTIDGDQCSQDEVESLLGFNFDLFINTIILAQGQPLFFDRPPREKMQLFTDVLALDKWETRAGAAKSKADDYDRQVTNATAQVESLKSELLTIKDMYKEYSERSDEWKDKHEQHLIELKDGLKEELARLEIVEAKHNRASIAYDEPATKLKLMQADRGGLYQEVRDAEREYDSIAAEKRRTMQDIERLERELASVQDAKTCPTCGQKVGAKDLAKHKEHITSKLTNLKTGFSTAFSRDLLDKVKAAQDSLSRQLENEKKFEEEAFKWRQELDWLTQELSQAKAVVGKLEASLTEVEQETNPYRDQASKLGEKLTLIKEDIKDGEGYVNRTRVKSERARYWVQGFKDIRLFIIEEVLDELQLASKVILEELGLIGWTIEYDVERETKSGTIQRGINIAIQSPSASSPVKWESWSGGEGQRLRLVGALALSEVLLGYAGIDTNLEILDEPTRHLSKEGVRDIWNYLADRAERLERNCFYVDHTSAESARFASVITVVKDESGVHIQEG